MHGLFYKKRLNYIEKKSLKRYNIKPNKTFGMGETVSDESIFT